MSAECDRGRCSPFPGSQDFPQSTINFHFGKSTHTHSDNGGRHLVLQQFPGKAGLDLTGHSLYFSKRAKGRRKTHLKRTGGVLRSVFLSIWCHLLRLQGHKETRQWQRAAFPLQVNPAFVVLFVSLHVQSSREPFETPGMETLFLLRLDCGKKTPKKEWSNRNGAGQCPVLQTQMHWSRGVSLHLFIFQNEVSFFWPFIGFNMESFMCSWTSPATWLVCIWQC